MIPRETEVFDWTGLPGCLLCAHNWPLNLTGQVTTLTDLEFASEAGVRPPVFFPFLGAVTTHQGSMDEHWEHVFNHPEEFTAIVEPRAKVKVFITSKSSFFMITCHNFKFL